MIIACPSCFTRYKVPEASLGATGRMVKCKNCGHTWHQEPPDPVVQPQAGAAPQQQQQHPQQPQQPQQTQGWQQTTQQHSREGLGREDPWQNPQQQAPVAPPPQQRDETGPTGGVPALHTAGGKKTLPLWMGMAMGAGLTLLVLGVGVLVKDPLLRAMPAMASIISANDPTENLKTQQPNTQGLVVENIERDILEEGGFTTYVIAGNVTNTNMKLATVPNLDVSLLDEHGKLIDQWTVQPDAAELAPGESTSWTCYFYNPPLAKVSEYKVEFANN